VLDQGVVGLACRGQVEQELLVVVVLALPDVRLLYETDEAVQEVRVHAIGVQQE